MTYESGNTITYGKFPAHLRDAITAETGWSIAEDHIDTQDANGNDGYFVVDSPGLEQVMFHFGRLDGVNTPEIGNFFGIKTGENWSTDGSGFDTVHTGSFRAEADTGENYDTDHPLKYWLETTERGFVVAVRGNQGDGSDGSFFAAVEEVNKLWDYSTASIRESDYRVTLRASNNVESSMSNWYESKEGGREKFRARGLVNPDPNFSNFPWAESIHKCNAYQNADTNEAAIIGTTDLIIEEHSSTETTTGDTIQDDGGNDIYQVLKLIDSLEPIGIRMD